MKKFSIILLFCFFTTGVIFAQGIRDERQAENAPEAGRQRTPQGERVPYSELRGIEAVSIDGELKLVNGFVAVQSSESTYIVPLLTRYIGFINGLQEGNTVSVEGFAMRNLLHPRKLTIEGREYNFLPGMFAQGFGQRQFNLPNRNQPAPQHQFNAPNRNQAPQRHFNTPNRNNEQRRRDSEKENERERRERPRRQTSIEFDEFLSAA